MIGYFTGVWPHHYGEVGHYCRIPAAQGFYARPGSLSTPWHSVYAPLGETEAVRAAWGQGGYRDEQPQGIGRVVVRDGWTLLSMWDRSGDVRGNSSASFAFLGELTGEQALERARELFPEVWARIDKHLATRGIVFQLEAVPPDRVG